MAVDREGLLKELTFAGNDPGHAGQISGAPTNYKGGRSMGRWIADAVMVGPIFSDLLTKADSAERMEVERDEARKRSMPHMCRDGHPEIRHADNGDDERCPVCRERDSAAAAQADVARLSAEVEALRATIRSASEAVHADSGYSSFPTTIDSEEASNLRRCRDIVVSAAALSRADKADSRERGE